MKNIAFLAPYTKEESFQKKSFKCKGTISSEKVDWGLQMHLIPDLWRLTKGEGIKVAVLDTGIGEHEDLEGAVVDCANFTGDEKIKDPHGTLVAGIIGARDNEVGVVGVAPKCELYSAQVLPANGSISVDAINNGLRWAIDKKVDIISMSLHISGPDTEMEKLINEASKNAFIICSAGNKGSVLAPLNYPARFDNTIAVGSIDRNQNIGFNSSRGPQVDVVAPGIGICTTEWGDYYARVNGTSFSAPFVSGVVALMLAKHRKYESGTKLENVCQLREHLRKTSIDLGVCGRDLDSGFGLINPDSLIRGNQLRY